MPALVTCGKQWNVGSDDFVLPALFAVIVRLVCIGAVIGVLIYLFVGPEGCPEPIESPPPFLYGSLFAFIGIQLVAVLVENIIFSISAKGSIYDPRPPEAEAEAEADHGQKRHKRKRHTIVYWLFVRVVTFFVEIAVVIICAVAVFGPAPYAAGALQCPEYHDGPLVFAEAVVVSLIVLLALYAIGFAIFLDPLGICCAPSLLKDPWHSENTKEQIDGDREPSLHLEDAEKGTSGDSDDKDKGRVHRNHIGLGRIFRKIRGVLCCLSSGGKRSRTTAMQEVALALHTVFSDIGAEKKKERLVPSDLVAGMILVSRNQKKERGKCVACKAKEGVSCTCLMEKFREQTIEELRNKGDAPKDYKTSPPQEFDFINEADLFEDLVYYMNYAMGIYGWTLHVFDNLCCGMCQLCKVTCCVCNYRCVNKRHGEDFHRDDLCTSGIGTIRLRSQLKEGQIEYATYENDYYKAPYSICIDHGKEAIVVSVRGTLSLKDALTDMSPRMEKIDDGHRIEGIEGAQYIHVGMYKTAKHILAEGEDHCPTSKLDGAEGKNHCLTDKLDDLRAEYSSYKLVITGHSLGAGVASVLAVLLKPKYKDLTCFAFSPPGCVFSFPLTYYSRSFTTSVVLGNDMIPRVSFQSLGNLKHQILCLLKRCKKPKAQVIFQPRWVENEKYVPSFVRKCCCGPHTDPDCEMRDVVSSMEKEKKDSGEKQQPSDANVSTGCRCCHVLSRSKYKKKATKKGQDIPAFPPGSMIHIRVTQTAKPLCLGYCYPNKLSVERISSEDLCVILMDRGMIDDHLPNSVLNALKRCRNQFLPDHSNAGTRDGAPHRQERESPPVTHQPLPVSRQMSNQVTIEVEVAEKPIMNTSTL